MTLPAPPFKVRAVFEYKSDYEDDLPFPVGSIIEVTEIEDDDWFSGVFNGKSGMFPRNFVEVLASEPEPTKEPPSTVSPIEPQQVDKVPKPSSPVQESTKHPDPQPAVETTKPQPKPVLPLFPNSQKRDDPYVVKKQFIASAKSSYVPQFKPRDDSFLVGGHGSRQDKSVNSGEIYSEHMGEEEQEVPAEEKLSLKERIALLQKRQQEEAEREAAALKRQEARKQKAAEEKERRLREQQEREERIASGLEEPDSDIKSIETTHTGASKKYGAESSGVIEEEGDEDEQEEQEEEGEVPQKPDEYEPGAEEEKESDGGDEQDEEELKRQKLVERMAKISGGRNMFGMMGMSPFGQPAPAPAAAKKEVKKQPQEEPQEEHQEESDEDAKPVPIVPFADPAALKKLRKASLSDPTESESASIHAPDAPAKEDSSMGEDHDTEPDISNRPPPIPTSPHNQRRSVIQSDSGIESAEEAIVPIERENTGYEADEEVEKLVNTSEESTPVRKASQKQVDAIIPQIPPVPSRTSAPPVPSVPPVPQSPVREKVAPPPVPDSPVRRPAPPPIPSVPPAPPVRSVPPVPTPVDSDEVFIKPNEEFGDESDSENEGYEETAFKDDDDFQFVSPPRSNTLPPNLPPPIPETRTPPAPPPSAVPSQPRRTSTDISSPLTYNNTGSSFGSIRRSSTDISRGRKDSTQAESVFDKLEVEIANINSASSWWLKGLLPEFLAARIGSDLIYEVDSNTIEKRGNRTKVYKDYYILFYDLSSITFELEYELEDPRTSVKFTNYFTKGIPIIRKDLLDKYYKTYGSAILNSVSANSGVGTKSIIDHIFKHLDKSALPPIGNKSFGVTVYRSSNNHSISKVDDVRPGDILCIKNGKFLVHKGLGSKTVIVGDEQIFASVIYEYDSKKDKFKVVEVSNGQLKRETYKMSEMKSGQVRVFRVVGRDYVDW